MLTGIRLLAVQLIILTTAALNIPTTNRKCDRTLFDDKIYILEIRGTPPPTPPALSPIETSRYLQLPPATDSSQSLQRPIVDDVQNQNEHNSLFRIERVDGEDDQFHLVYYDPNMPDTYRPLGFPSYELSPDNNAWPYYVPSAEEYSTNSQFVVAKFSMTCRVTVFGGNVASIQAVPTPMVIGTLRDNLTLSTSPSVRASSNEEIVSDKISNVLTLRDKNLQCEGCPTLEMWVQEYTMHTSDGEQRVNTDSISS